jgi:hypothetical protein
VNDSLLKLELALRGYETQRSKESRAIARQALQDLIEPNSKNRNLGEQLERALSRPRELRNVALAFLRTLGVEGVIDLDGEDNGLHRHLVRASEQALPDFGKYYKTADYKQNYEKIARLATVHKDIVGQIESLRTIGSTQHEFMGCRTEIMKVLNRDIVKAYLAPYELTSINQSIHATFAAFENLIATRNYEFPVLLETTQAQIIREIDGFESNPSFLAQDFVRAFFSSADRLCSSLNIEARGQLQATIAAARDSSQLLEKRYPLHEVGRTIGVSVPLRNEGPGVAIDVSAQITVAADTVATNGQPLLIGDVPQGSFSLFFECLVIEPTREAEIFIEIEWGQVLSRDRLKLSLVVPLRSQPDKVDWDLLAQTEPYSLEVAEGDEFVGRQSKISSIAARLMRPRMVSTYITGQKRIGKSSLSLAVRDRVHSVSHQTHFMTLDRGDYAHEDPRTTLRMLGERISEFFGDFIPGGIVTDLNFDGTLAPLNRLADRLIAELPQKRFVIVLDEFDGIHPELYRMGPLAETFFSNLRTLSAKRNVAFILVGGENMPFIISAQGDELNKFSHESLTYFSRVNEWQEFCSLVQKPVAGELEWYESALNSLFVSTNGHPYYTKLVCAEIFRRAVQERDAEIAASEAEPGVATTIATLDTNAFAHLWKDGIGGSREESEVVSLRRCRVLIAIGRVLRDGIPLTTEAIASRKGLFPLSNVEVANTVQEFCNRRILQEDGSVLQFTLPLFREWLKQSGVNLIIPDIAADELATEIKAAEDQAYVKDGEIVALTSAWPPHRGRQLTAMDVRSWLEQLPSRIEQRLLFKILLRLNIWSDLRIRESLINAHRLVSRSLPLFVKKHRAERRSDVIITYIDGPGKSGADYARRYAEDNGIAAYCILEMGKFSETLQDHESRFNVNTRAVVIVDDIIATGKTMSDNIQSFIQANRQAIQLRNPSIRIVAICATPAGQQRVRNKLQNFVDLDIDLIVSEPLGEESVAFPPSEKAWSSADEAEAAKALCRRIGSHLVKSAPLGFGDLGLLIVLPQTCPNNSLPLLYAQGTKDFSWRPLFSRPVN